MASPCYPKQFSHRACFLLLLLLPAAFLMPFPKEKRLCRDVLCVCVHVLLSVICDEFPDESERRVRRAVTWLLGVF